MEIWFSSMALTSKICTLNNVNRTPSFLLVFFYYINIKSWNFNDVNHTVFLWIGYLVFNVSHRFKASGLVSHHPLTVPGIHKSFFYKPHATLCSCVNISGSSYLLKMEGANPQILKMAAEIIHDKDRRATTTVCVTGASGYVASWLVKCLLNQGYIVHATVRDPENEAKVRHLLDIPRDEESLELFRAELSEDGSFDAAVAGCAGVFHVASPTEFAPKDPENDVIKPAVEGTLNVLQSCTKAKTVKRVVVTSSAAAIAMKESEDQNQYMDESCWTDVGFVRTKMSNSNWAYRVSKTLAEQAALQYGKEHDLDVVTIIPVIVVGSSITPNVPISVQLALSLLTGIPSDLQVLKELQLPSGALSLVHVDDLCKAHIFLMENPSTEGRYICNAMDIPVAQLAHYLSKRYPEYNVPTQFEDVPVISKLNPSSKKLVESGFSFKLGLDESFDDAVKYLKMKGMLN